MKHLSSYKPISKLKLSEIEKLIRVHRIIVPAPTRRTLIGFCEDGTFVAARQPGGGPWLVSEDSFLAWVKGLDSEF